MHGEARGRVLRSAAKCAPAVPVTPGGQAHSLAGTLRVTQLHPPVQRRDAAIAGRLIEHRVTLCGSCKRLRVAFLLDLERLEPTSPHHHPSIALHYTRPAPL